MAGYLYFNGSITLSSDNSVAPPSLVTSSRDLALSCSAPENCTERKSSTSAEEGRRSRVSIFWDLDNKPPKSSPYHAALHLHTLASQFGDVADMVACANRNAFLHIPRWVQEQRGITYSNLTKKHALRDFSNPNSDSEIMSDTLGVSAPSYICAICGVVCASRIELKKHARLSHRQELRNMGFKAHECVGYGLHMELMRAGFFVRMVDQSAQAADRALKRQIKHAMDTNVGCICLVTDDSDFTEILRAARSKHVLTVVIGDLTSLQSHADIWFPWTKVAQGKDITKICRGERRWLNEVEKTDVTTAEFLHDSSLGANSKCDVDEKVEDIDALWPATVPKKDSDLSCSQWVFEGG